MSEWFRDKETAKRSIAMVISRAIEGNVREDDGAAVYKKIYDVLTDLDITFVDQGNSAA